MNVCSTRQQLDAAIDQIRNVFHIRGPILLQEYLTGRDINVGCMERRDEKTQSMEAWILPITEEDYSALPENLPRICGFESKVNHNHVYE
jgi:D-alanine-D-alanine ligase